jgi:hypothetical protein
LQTLFREEVVRCSAKVELGIYFYILDPPQDGDAWRIPAPHPLLTRQITLVCAPHLISAADHVAVHIGG